MKFSEFNLALPLLKALETSGFTKATPIQAQAIPLLLDGKDIVASAQTGTGKTAAYVLPILHKLCQKKYKGFRPTRALVLVPTRELATQVGDTFRNLGAQISPKLRPIEVFGGVKLESQEFKLKEGADILIATPGRLLELLEQGTVKLSSVEMTILDEGDRLLELGFMPDLRKIHKHLPGFSQTALFSATYVGDIDSLAHFMLKRPQRLDVSGANVVAAKIRQVAHMVADGDKPMALRTLLSRKPNEQSLVFVNQRASAASITKGLAFAGLPVVALHGDLTQKDRTKMLDSFLQGKAKVMVATDVAARGLHIPALPLVVNYELPVNVDDYVHRIGRTGRIGHSGNAVSLVDCKELSRLADIEELIGEKLPRLKLAGFKPSSDAPRKKGAPVEDLVEKITQGAKKGTQNRYWGAQKKRNAKPGEIQFDTQGRRRTPKPAQAGKSPRKGKGVPGRKRQAPK